MRHEFTNKAEDLKRGLLLFYFLARKTFSIMEERIIRNLKKFGLVVTRHRWARDLRLLFLFLNKGDNNYEKKNYY